MQTVGGTEMNKLVANIRECPIIYDRNRGKAGNLSHEFVTLILSCNSEQAGGNEAVDTTRKQRKGEGKYTMTSLQDAPQLGRQIIQAPQFNFYIFLKKEYSNSLKNLSQNYTTTL